MDEYLCVTVLSRPDESQADFSSRLTQFWTNILRSQPDEFEQVYAETTAFTPNAGRQTRQYLIEAPLADRLSQWLQENGIDFEPIDEDETYSKYEAVPPEWFWIEH